jgi:hypothetical protein
VVADWLDPYPGSLVPHHRSIVACRVIIPPPTSAVAGAVFETFTVYGLCLNICWQQVVLRCRPKTTRQITYDEVHDGLYVNAAISVKIVKYIRSLKFFAISKASEAVLSQSSSAKQALWPAIRDTSVGER